MIHLEKNEESRIENRSMPNRYFDIALHHHIGDRFGPLCCAALFIDE